jgi:gamma-glutamyltranspeptidase / glutathione hydrolase
MRLAALRLLVSVALFGSLVAAAPAPADKPSARRPAREGVASESRLVSQAALATLRAGGTAADAAVTAALVAGVVSPTSSGLGGGGFALVWQAHEGTATILDFRETAPALLDTEAFERRPLPAAERGKLVGVPAESLGLAELHRRFGKLPWRTLVAPAERFAREGFPVEPHLASSLAGGADYRRMASVDQSFWPRGKVAVVGTRVTRKKLGRTLARLATEGPAAIHDGPIAQDLVDAARAYGSGLTRGDMTAYRVRERKPLRLAWEGYDVFTMPPPSAGGIMLAEVLGWFAASELKELGEGTPARIHLLAEALRGGFADRFHYVGDPDYLPVDIERLIARPRIAARKTQSHPGRTRTVKAIGVEEHGTHALVVTDAAGNVVSLTTTVNTGFGADIEGEASGIVLNDELDDFTSKKWSLPVGVAVPPNLPRPLLRPVSSMTPTLVLRSGKPVLALGGSGGMRIAPNVVQVLLTSLVDGAAPEKAVAAPRIRPHFGDYTIALEPGFSSAIVADLAQRGEKVKTDDASASAVQLLSWGEHGLSGAADPRKSGVVLVR